jgi:spore germination cell wall hydrolase CwlJ-like protein
MSRKLQRASALALVATFVSIFATSDGAGAQVQGAAPVSVEAADPHAADIRFIAEEVVQPLPEKAEPEAAPTSATSLAELVASMPEDDELSDEMQCLAGAIYFESRGEPLAGQLAVGRVIVNRAASGRFPSTYCGVVFQKSQFSFVRGGRMPRINTASLAWRNARAIARIAHEGTWDSPAQGALYFHAKHVRPGWRLTRVAQVSRHIFYR